jgi:hypothetical protein
MDEKDIIEVNILDLPNELKFEIAYYLDPKSLLRLCQTSNEVNNICKSNNFWKRKYKHDYGDIVTNTDDYREIYKKKTLNIGNLYLKTGTQNILVAENVKDFYCYRYLYYIDCLNDLYVQSYPSDIEKEDTLLDVYIDEVILQGSLVQPIKLFANVKSVISSLLTTNILFLTGSVINLSYNGFYVGEKNIKEIYENDMFLTNNDTLFHKSQVKGGINNVKYYDNRYIISTTDENTISKIDSEGNITQNASFELPIKKIKLLTNGKIFMLFEDNTSAIYDFRDNEIEEIDDIIDTNGFLQFILTTENVLLWDEDNVEHDTFDFDNYTILEYQVLKFKNVDKFGGADVMYLKLE